MRERTSQKGFALCVVGPSGSGKTSLCDKLAAETKGVIRSISMTTRPQRPGERSGEDYIFVSEAKFEDLKDSGELLEYAEVFGAQYGTPAQPVHEAIHSGKVIVMDIDTVGAHYLSQRLKEDCLRVFIFPPSMDELRRRLLERKQNSEEDLARRLAEAAREMQEGRTYEHQIINDDFDRAYHQLQNLVQSRLGS